MQITVRMAVGLGIVLLLFTMYYLEDEIGKDRVFWLYSSLGVVFGAVSVYAVAKDSPNERNYIVLAVLFVLLAILYYEEEEEIIEVEERKEKRKKKREKKRRTKR